MITEQRRSRLGSVATPISESPTSSRTPSCSRPLSCSPPSFSPHPKRTRTMSLDEEVSPGSICGGPRAKRLGSVPLLRNLRKTHGGSLGGSSVDLSTSVVPEDFELPVEEAVSPHLEANCVVNVPLSESTSALFRKRSSSLPRILPPILDQDGVEDDSDISGFSSSTGSAAGENGTGNGKRENLFTSVSTNRINALKQMDQTSNLIVREMQKFVCRHASDVSQVLPLPLPANSRQQNRIQFGNKSVNKKSSKLDWKHTRVLMQSLAKFHAISYAISEKSPGLFQVSIQCLIHSKYCIIYPKYYSLQGRTR